MEKVKKWILKMMIGKKIKLDDHLEQASKSLKQKKLPVLRR